MAKPNYRRYAAGIDRAERSGTIAGRMRHGSLSVMRIAQADLSLGDRRPTLNRFPEGQIRAMTPASMIRSAGPGVAHLNWMEQQGGVLAKMGPKRRALMRDIFKYLKGRG